MSLLETNDFIMQKKILSAHEHYDFMDLKGNKLGEADGNIIQVPPKFVVLDTHGFELMHLQGKTFSLQREFTFYDSARRRAGNNKDARSPNWWAKNSGSKKTARSSCAFTEISPNTNIKWRLAGAPVASIHKKWVYD